ncbi:hypothetical protein Gpo141_00006413 [Globisporangium polare]
MQHAKSSPNAPPPTTLTEHVYCGDSIRGRLLPEATTLVNSIVADITKRAKPHISSDDGTGLIVQVCDREQLHAALALPGSPLEQGADASASTELFCDWLVGSALGTPKVDQVTEITMAGWTKQEQVVVGLHYLTLQDANAIVYMQWQKSEWVLAMRASGIRPFALVLCIAASGDRVTLYELVYVFD